jgi:hypothetical protein
MANKEKVLLNNKRNRFIRYLRVLPRLIERSLRVAQEDKKRFAENVGRHSLWH